jgi:hypothetical protein
LNAGKISPDGDTRLLFNDNGTWRLADIQSDFSGINLAEELPIPENSSVSVITRRFLYGDLTGNGRDDLFYTYSGETGVNNTIGYTVLEGGSMEQSIVSYDRPLIRTARLVSGLDDVTGNGHDDFAVFYENNDQDNELVFYQGGSSWQTPHHTWTIPGNGQVAQVISGRFADVNRRDVAFITSIQTNEGYLPRLLIYEVGSNPSNDPYFTLIPEEYYPGLDNYSNILSILNRAGDVNNNGYDDLLVSSAFNVDSNGNPLPAGLFYGGPQLSAGSPDVWFDGFEDVGGFGIGGGLYPLGDLNSDGIDDFAIVNVDEKASQDSQQYGVDGGGRVHIFLGQDGTPDFSESDYVLSPDTASMQEGYSMWLFGLNEIAVGDFSGDGNKDIAVKPLMHQIQGSLNQGVPGIHIFHGAALSPGDNQPQQMIPLWNQYFQPFYETNEPYVGYNGRMYMKGVADITGNGADELLAIASSGMTNAVLHYGGEVMNNEPDILFEAPNRRLSMGSPGNFINRQYDTALGDFTGDGKLNFVTVQFNDRYYRDTPVYMYQLDATPTSTEPEAQIPSQVTLAQNYPNPFNPTTQIEYALPEPADVRLEVYNIMGQRVATLVSGQENAGYHSVNFNASSLASGMYIYRLQAGSFVQTRKMMLVK